MEGVNVWEAKLMDKIMLEKNNLIETGQHVPWDTKLPMCESIEKRKILIDRLNDESPIELNDAILEKIGLDHKEVKQYWNYFEKHNRICGHKENLFQEDFGTIWRLIKEQGVDDFFDNYYSRFISFKTLIHKNFIEGIFNANKFPQLLDVFENAYAGKLTRE